MLDLGEWIGSYGLPLIFTITFLSCLALPVPASLAMMIAGTFAAAQEFSLLSPIVAALSGAVAGDQTGYLLARKLLGPDSRISTNPRWQSNLQKARIYQQKWGGLSVFFSRWLASPLGPWVNFASGITEFNYLRFTLWGVLGEVIWVTSYVGLGYLFSSQIHQIADLTANLIWIALSVSLLFFLGRKLFKKTG